jgi:heptosyltransferase I
VSAVPAGHRLPQRGGRAIGLRQCRPVNILIVKLSSLGDVVHTMPAVQDLRAARPDAVIDWVVEAGFASLVQRCEGVHRVIGFGLRRWRRGWPGARTVEEWRAYRRELRAQRYDVVLDLQGLTKSALVSRAAHVTDGGRRYALGNRTEGSGWEAPTRWLADVPIRIEPRIHAVTRSRELCARALGYAIPRELRFGLHAIAAAAVSRRCVAFIHGTSRDDKCWPEPHWLELGRRLLASGCSIGLPHGDDAERERAERLAAALGAAAQVWPRVDLGQLTDRLAACAGVVGVDSGLSHVAVALDLPHVQIYNFETAWRTGPMAEARRQTSVSAAPTPSVDAVWHAWQQVSTA